MAHSFTSSLFIMLSFVLVAPLWGQGAVREEGDAVIVQSADSILRLSKAGVGAILSLQDRQSGREYLADDKNTPLFRLSLTRADDKSGEAIAISSGDASEMTVAIVPDDGQDAIELRYSGFADWPQLAVHCHVAVRKDDALLRWRLRVSGAPTLVLEESQYPLLLLMDCLGDSRADDMALAGATEGGAYMAPGDWKRGYQRRYFQPGSLAAQFASYHDPAGGFFTATQDAVGYQKAVTIARQNGGVEYRWSHQCFHPLAEPYELPYDVVCTTFRSPDPARPSDWRDAADIHKRWAMTQPWCAKTVAARQDIPEWIKRGCIRVQWELRSDGQPDAVINWLDNKWAKYFPNLPPFLTFFSFEHVATWVAPKYTPFYPSDDAFTAMTRHIADMGGHVCLFPSTYQWSVTYRARPDGSFDWDDRKDFAAIGEKHAVKDRMGTTILKKPSWLQGGQTAALCRGDAWTREFFRNAVDDMAARGVDVVQLDQVVGGAWPSDGRTACFNPEHGHPLGFGRWDSDAFHEQMTLLRARADAKYPGMVFSLESPQELFAQDFGLYDYRHARSVFNINQWEQYPRKHAAIFPYLYNEYVPVFHIPPHSEPVGLILAQAVVSGEMPSCKQHQIKFPGEPLVVNGDFDKPSATPTGWTIWRNQPHGPATVEYDSTTPAQGAAALRIVGTNAGEVVNVYQLLPLVDVPLKAGGKYRLRFMMKSKELSSTRSGVSLSAMSDTNWQFWKELEAWHANAASSQDWQSYEQLFTVPAGTKAMRITLHLSGKGSVAFDQVILDEQLADGSFAEMKRPGNTVFTIMSQWAALAAAGAGKYFMQGKMLHPPPLTTARLEKTVRSSRAAKLNGQLYTMTIDAGRTVDSASCAINLSASQNAWLQHSMDITVTAGAREIHVPISLRQKGEILYDDFVLTEIGGNGDNLLPNPSFENWVDPAQAPAGWVHLVEYRERVFKGTYHREEKDVHNGNYAIRLACAVNDDLAQLKQVLPIDGSKLAVGKSYRLSFWVKTRNIARWLPIEAKHEFPAILHNAFQAPDGDCAVLMINICDEPQTGSLQWQGRETTHTLQPWELKLVERKKNID
ncbi:MAG: DUF6259 domain-containing protein [Kiritimatiellia bacterium]|nr:DUF6259 domain-containing protein [Lentisphaeria bacterium]